MVVLTDGEVAPVMWACRGRVLLQNYRDLPFGEWLFWAARREKDVILYKNPAAVALGQRKRGVLERPSAAKLRAARANGKLASGPRR